MVDGTGNPWFTADIGIERGKIAKISDSIGDEAERIIDATSLLVSPGFIDIHGHSDYLLLADPFAENKVAQGVTTDVSGNCGLSAAPLGKLWLGDWWVDDIRDRFSMLSWDKAKQVLRRHGIDLSWGTIGGYLGELENQGSAINYCQLVGHHSLRAAVMGDVIRRPNLEELEEMKALLRQSMDDGAFGFSCGFDIPHEVDTSEFMEFCKVVAEEKGIFAIHIRSLEDKVIESVSEAIEIAEKTNVRTTISHLMVNGKINWGKAQTALELIDEARARGLEIYCDQIPYPTGGGNHYSPEVNSLLPDWVLDAGINEGVKRLTDPKVREKTKEEMRKGITNKWFKSQWFPLKEPLWEDMISIISCEKDKDLEGKTIKEIARMKKNDPYDALLDVVIRDPSAKVVLTRSCKEDVAAIMRHPTTMFGSDGGILAPIRRLGIPHPRQYGTFPRVLGKYVRENKTLTLEEAIRKMTSLPAQALRLTDRGLIREQMHADITIFDPEKIQDKPNYTDYPRQWTEGIEYVLVNGQVVMEEGRHVKVLAGKVLRHHAMSKMISTGS